MARREGEFTRPRYLVGCKPFWRLPLKQRAVFVLHLAGFTQREISKLIRTSLQTINTYISNGYKEYGDKN